LNSEILLQRNQPDSDAPGMAACANAFYVMPMRDPASELRQKDQHAAVQKPAGVEELPCELNLCVREVPFEGGGECPDIDFSIRRSSASPRNQRLPARSSLPRL
jgi:hypothetical protein